MVGFRGRLNTCPSVFQKDHPVIAGHLRSLRRFACIYLAHCELGLPSLVHFPVRPISDVHVCRLPPFPGSSVCVRSLK